MDKAQKHRLSKYRAYIIGAVFVVVIPWLMRPDPVEAFSYFQTETCTATYAGNWFKKNWDGTQTPFTAEDYGSDCSFSGTSGVKPYVSISEPNQDMVYGGTFSVRGMAIYNICLNSLNSYTVSVTVSDADGNSVTLPTPPQRLTESDLRQMYQQGYIYSWQYQQYAQRIQLGQVIYPSDIANPALQSMLRQQQRGLAQGESFNIGPFGPYLNGPVTIRVTTIISPSWGGSFVHTGEMGVRVMDPAPDVPSINEDNPSSTWEVGGRYRVYVASKAYPTATDISLEVRDYTYNPQQHFNVVTAGPVPFPSGAAPNEKILRFPFEYTPPRGGSNNITARACNTVGEIRPCSGWSPIFNKQVQEMRSPPSNVRAFGQNNAVILTWGLPSGGASPAGYRVYRALSSGALSLLTLDAINIAGNTRVCTKSSTTPCIAGDRATISATIEDSFRDAEVNNGTIYYYVVRAKSATNPQNNSVQYSPASPEVSATPDVTAARYQLNVVADPNEFVKGEYADTVSVSALGTTADVEIPVELIVTERQPANPNVYGWAWGGGYVNDGGEESDTLGWISLNCTNEGNCETGPARGQAGFDYGVKIEDYPDGPYKGKRAKVSGFAWAGGKERKPDVDNPTGPSDYQDTDSNGWICFGVSCPGTAPGVVEKSGTGLATVEPPAPSDAWINIDTNSTEEWGTVHGWAKVLNLGNDGWVRLGGQSKHATGVFERFPLRLSKDPDVSHANVAGKTFRTFEGHAWGNGRVAPGNADEQDCQSNPQCVNPVGWIDFGCENNSFGVTCTELHNKQIPGINDRPDPATNKAGWPQCSNNFTNQPYADCFAVGTDYVPPFANLLASKIRIKDVNDPANPTDLNPIGVPTGRRVTMRDPATGVAREIDVDEIEGVINVVQDQKIQFVADIVNIGGSDIPGNKHWDNAFYNLRLNDRVTADATDGHVPVKRVRKSDDNQWDRGYIKTLETDPNDPFVFPVTVMGCAQNVYTCRHYIWFKADINNELPEELSKSDNIVGPLIINVVANRPDLQIVDMVPLADPLASLPPATPLPTDLAPLAKQYYSDTFTMLVGIKNTGLKPATLANLPIAIYKRPKPATGSPEALALNATGAVATRVLPNNTPALAVDATFYTQITIVTKDLGSPADYVLTGYVDNRGDTPPGTGVLPEMNENNNQSNTCGRGTAATTPCAFTVAIDPPDLTITSMSVSRTKVKPGGIVKITAKVKNIGDSALSSDNSMGNVVTGLYMLLPGDTSPLPIPISKNDFSTKSAGAFTTKFRDLAAGAQIDIETLGDTDPLNASIEGYKMPTTIGTYTFCAFVDVLDTVYEGRLGGERNNGSGSARFPECKTIEVQNLPLAVTSCQATYEGNYTAQVRWTAPARNTTAPVNGYVVERWLSGAQTIDTVFARSTNPLAPGLDPARTSYTDSGGPRPFECQTRPNGYQYRVVSINEVGETSTTCSGIVNCSSSAYLEYNIKSSFPQDLSIRVGRAVHKPDPNGDPAFDDVLPDIDHYEEFNPATGCKYTGDSVDATSLEGECAEKFTPASTASSTHTPGAYSSTGSSINLDRFFGNLSPSFPSNQWYMKVRDHRQQEAIDVLPLNTAPPVAPPVPPKPTAVSRVIDTHGYEPSSLQLVGNKPVVAYKADLGELKIAFCDTIKCENPNIVNLGYGGNPSLQVFNGMPAIAYTETYRQGNPWDDYRVKLLVCGDSTCSDSTKFINVVVEDVGYGPPSMRVNGANLVIAYTSYNIRNSDEAPKLKVAVCVPNLATTTAPCTNKVLDSTGAKEPSLALNAGNPVIAYNAEYTLKLSTCTDAQCATAPTPLVIERQQDDGGQQPSLLLQAGGIPAIAYTTYQGGNKVKLARCSDVTCSTINKLVVNPNGGNVSLAATSTGVALTYVARQWPTNGTVQLARCGTSICDTQVLGNFSGYFGSTSLQVNGEIAFASFSSGGLKLSRIEPLNPTNAKINISWGPLYSVEVNPDGTPSIVFGKDTYDRNIINCTSSSCPSPTTNRMSPAASWRSMSFQPNGDRPMFSYYKYSGNNSSSSTIGVARCNNRACTQVETKDAITAGWQSSLQLNGDRPVVAFMGNGGELKLLLCGTPVTGNPCPDPVVKSIDSGATNPQRNGGVTLKLNNGLPVIAFSGGDSQIKVLFCDDATCSTHTTTSIDTPGSSRPDIVLNDGKPVMAYEHVGRLKIAFCSDSVCSAVIYKDGPAMDRPNGYEGSRQLTVGQAPSIQLLSDKSPIIGYVGSSPNRNPMLAWCSDGVECRSIATRTISTTAKVLNNVFVRMVGADPLIVYDIIQSDDNFLGIVSGIFNQMQLPWVGTDRPRAGEEFATDNPEFKWVYDAQGRANPERGWRVQVSTDPNFGSTVIDTACTPSATNACSDTSFQQSLDTTARKKGQFSIAAATASALVRGQRYYWRVMVQDTLGTLGAGAWSGSQSFSIAAAPPGDQHEILNAKIVKVGSSNPETVACAPDPTVSAPNPKASPKTPVDPANHNTVTFADLQEGYVYFACEADDNQQIEVIPSLNDITSGEIHIKPGKPAKKVRIDVSTSSGRPRAGGRRMTVEVRDNFPAAPQGQQKKITRKIRLAEADRGRGDHNGREENDSRVSFDSTRRAPSISNIEIEIGAAIDALPGRYELTVDVTSDGPATTKVIPVVVQELLPSALCIKPIQPKASARIDETVGCVLVNPANSGGRCTTPPSTLRCNSGTDTSWGTCVACFLGTVQEGKQNQSLNYTATGPAGLAQRIGLINPGGMDVDFTLRGRGSQGTGTDTRFQLYKEVTPESGNMIAVPFGSFTGVATAQDPQFDVSIPPHVPALDPNTGSYPQQIFEVIPQTSSDPVNSAQVYYQYFVNRAPIATPQYPILGDSSRRERRQGSTNADDCENVAGLHDYHTIYNAAFGYDSCNKDDRAYDASNPLKPKLAWKFEDLDAVSPNRADKQTKYQLEVRNLDGTVVLWSKGPTVTNGPTNGNETFVQYAGTALAWNTSYKWRVKVWDNNGGDSGDLANAPWFTFVTPRHPDPIADFTYSPKIVLANTEIHFTNNSQCYDDGAANQVPVGCPDPRYGPAVSPATQGPLLRPGATYFWIFGKPDGTPLQFNSSQKSTLKNPTYQFLEGGDQTVTLTVIDQTGYTSSPQTTTLGNPNATPTSTVPQIQCDQLPNQCAPATVSNPSCKQECIKVQTIEFRRRAP